MVSATAAHQSGDEQTPTTPRPTFADPPAHEIPENPCTPTRDNFAGVPGQRPLPDEPFTPHRDQDLPTLKRDLSHRATTPTSAQDVEMGDADDDDGLGDDDGSDNESVNSDSQPPSKKKKGQRFFCTDFPPCQLSFTRSEHLARHIRKHTGERPFQCHCSRRFSRLDNLRQHAQTVHINEEIPGDSLAATSTRFQRQIRTERVRPSTGRSRASTIGSQAGHTRGHSRTQSASSIGSTASSIGGPDDVRRRPQPLAMANDPTVRARLSLSNYDYSGSPQHYGYYNQSPTGYSTPTSTSFSTAPGSPHFGPGMASPPSAISRSSSYHESRRAPGRRLSVPSGAHPFHISNTSAYAPPYFSPIPSGTSVAFSPGGGSVFGSPASSVYYGRTDAEIDLEHRRRTWHPGTINNYSQRPATSGLMYHQTVDDQRLATTAQPAATQVSGSQVKLPGIESFDHAPSTAARASPMLVDARPSSSNVPSDAGLHQNLTRLDITAANAPVEGQWQAVQPPGLIQPVTFGQQPVDPSTRYISHQHSASMPEQPVTPLKNKRQGFYGGPSQPSQNYLFPRTSPEDSGSSDGAPTPSTSQGTEYLPVIVNPNGNQDMLPPGAVLTEEQKVYYASHSKPEPARADSGFHPYAPQYAYAVQAGHEPRFSTTYVQPQRNNMSKLEALVAVATSEGRAVEQRP